MGKGVILNVNGLSDRYTTYKTTARKSRASVLQKRDASFRFGDEALTYALILKIANWINPDLYAILKMQ